MLLWDAIESTVWWKMTDRVKLLRTRTVGSYIFTTPVRSLGESDMFRHWGSLPYVGASVFVALCLALAAVAAPFLFRTPSVNANGFTVPVAQGVSGPYEYVIGVWPPKPVEGWNLFMSTALSANQQPVTNAVVTVTGAVEGQAGVEVPLDVSGLADRKSGDQTTAGSSLIWAVFAFPLAILALGLTGWGFRRRYGKKTGR